jgi:hypothetical protein
MSIAPPRYFVAPKTSGLFYRPAGGTVPTKEAQSTRTGAPFITSADRYKLSYFYENLLTFASE